VRSIAERVGNRRYGSRTAGISPEYVVRDKLANVKSPHGLGCPGGTRTGPRTLSGSFRVRNDESSPYYDCTKKGIRKTVTANNVNDGPRSTTLSRDK